MQMTVLLMQPTTDVARSAAYRCTYSSQG